MTGSVTGHYGAAGIVARLLAAVPWSADLGVPLTAAQLYPFDQLHGRELLATQEHAARLNPRAGTHLLDIGSGVGGPARYFATTFGCRVTGIDLTPEFIATSRELSELCGLDDLLTFIEADAKNIPLGDKSVDHTYGFYVGMNLPDKSAALRECARVVKPGGRVIWTEVTQAAGDPHYPLPWARTGEDSYVETSDRLVTRFAHAGFEILSIDDETGAHLELAQQLKNSGRAPSPQQLQFNEVVLGADFAERRKNYIRSLGEGLIVSTLIEARVPV
jgi:ubiquinone/menaquinone biosynthesis C-methylase UbiE